MLPFASSVENALAMVGKNCKVPQFQVAKTHNKKNKSSSHLWVYQVKIDDLRREAGVEGEREGANARQNNDQVTENFNNRTNTQKQRDGIGSGNVEMNRKKKHYCVLSLVGWYAHAIAQRYTHRMK